MWRWPPVSVSQPCCEDARNAAQWGEHAGADLLIVSGEEVTTRSGRWPAWNVPMGKWIDWRYRAQDRLKRGCCVARVKTRSTLETPCSDGEGELRTCLTRGQMVLGGAQGRRPVPGASRRVMSPIMAHLTMASWLSGSRS